MALDDFCADFYWVTGYEIPYSLLGFRDVLEMLRADPYSGMVQVLQVFRHYYIRKVSEYPSLVPAYQQNGLLENLEIIDLLENHDDEIFEW